MTKNPHGSADYQRKWRADHPGKCAEYSKRYHKKAMADPEKHKRIIDMQRICNRRYYKKHRKRILAERAAKK